MVTKIDIDLGDDREKLAQTTGISSASSDIPLCLQNTDTTTFTIGNYIGWEDDGDGRPNLLPTVSSLIYYSYLTSPPNQANRLLALAREGALERCEEVVKKALQQAIIQADKDANGQYTLNRRQTYKVRKSISQHSIIWGAPAQTTDQNGLTRAVKTGLVHFARKYDTNLSVLAIELSQDKLEEKIPEALHLQEINLPSVVYEPSTNQGAQHEKGLNKIANEAITIYSLALIASLLPENQRGEYEKRCPFVEMQIQQFVLFGLQKEGLYVSGGFLDEQIATPKVQKQARFSGVRHWFRELVERK